MIRRSTGILLLLLPLVSPRPSYAHAFGILYNLPVPFWLYLYGGAAALVLSFLAIGYFFNKKNVSYEYSAINLSKFKIFRIFTSPGFFSLLKTVSVLLFLLSILTGLIGVDIAVLNFNMTFFWIIFIIGLTYFTAVIGNVFAIINPLKVVIEWIESIRKKEFKGIFKYYRVLSYWPALIFYVLFIWIELFGNTTPYNLSLLLLGYFVVSLIGVILVGKNAWFKYCDFLAVFFRLISYIAPVEYKHGNLYLRPPFVGLLQKKAEHISLLLFILFMLSSTAYDGLRETLPWRKLYWYLTDPIGGLGNNFWVYQTTGLILSPLVFLVLYMAFVGFAKKISGSELSLKDLALRFALSLVPIAFVYHFAHYYTLLLSEGQNIFSLISDPLGVGWNLFNTAYYAPNLSLIDAGITWHTQVGSILLGHIAGVYLAHMIALKTFSSHKKALSSQIPMLILMVIYTMAGLWILSQPITAGQ